MLDAYQEFTITTAIYPEAGTGSPSALMYLACGLSGESGEVAEKIKKFYRDGKHDTEEVGKELGDVLYYLTRLADELGLSMEDVLRRNMAKLQSRKARGVLQGSGDNR